MGLAAKELEQTQYGIKVVKVVPPEMFGTQKPKKISNFRCLMRVKGVVAVPQRLEVREDSLEIVDTFVILVT